MLACDAKTRMFVKIERCEMLATRILVAAQLATRAPAMPNRPRCGSSDVNRWIEKNEFHAWWLLDWHSKICHFFNRVHAEARVSQCFQKMVSNSLRNAVSMEKFKVFFLKIFLKTRQSRFFWTKFTWKCMLNNLWFTFNLLCETSYAMLNSHLQRNGAIWERV